MNVGQRAMATAKLYPEPEKVYVGKKGKTAKLLENKSFSTAALSLSLSQARTVIRYLPQTAEAAVGEAETE